MTLAWLARAASTLVVALVVALAVPVSQLRLVNIVKECCCPDPDNCHCPDHKTDQSGQPAMKACHNTTHALISPEAPGFVAPVVIAASTPRIASASPELPLASPHPAPPPVRPDAPS